MTNTAAVVRNFLVNDSNQPIDEDELDRSSDLLEEGVLDSLSLMVLVEFLSARYEIAFEPEEVIPQNFMSVEAIADLVDRKLRRKG
jgi:acyl carrier protein